MPTWCVHFTATSSERNSMGKNTQIIKYICQLSWLVYFFLLYSITIFRQQPIFGHEHIVVVVISARHYYGHNMVCGTVINVLQLIGIQIDSCCFDYNECAKSY